MRAVLVVVANILREQALDVAFEFSAFLKMYIARWAGDAGVL
jgi:hypothetical protein